MADPNRLSEHSKRECEPSESGSSADEKWFCLHCDEIDKELNNNQPTEKEPVTKENIDTTKNQLTKKPAKEEIRETTEKEPSTKEYIDTTKNQPTEKEPVKKEITKTTEKEPVSKEKIQTTNKQSTNKELMMKEKTSYLNDIKVIKIDDPSNEPMPKTSKNNETKNRDPDDPHREDSLESNESFKRRFVRLPLNKDPPKFIEKFLVFLSYLLVVIALPFSLFAIFIVVRQFERAVILRNGKVRKNQVFGPGLVHYLPCIDTVKFLDLRIICYSVPPQEALTKDSLTVSIDAVIYYKICDPISAVINVADYRSSTQFLAATMLRNALGTRKLAELLMDRPAVCFQIFHNMKRVARDWGITIVRVEVKEISLPIQLQKAMAAEAESSRLANAKIIVANAEIESSRNLQLATNILMDNPLCMQLRYLQSLQMISGDQTHTIVFPFSIEQIKKILK